VRVQRLIDAVIWLSRPGRHTSRDTAASIEQVGFAIDRRDRFLFRRPAPGLTLATGRGAVEAPEVVLDREDRDGAEPGVARSAALCRDG
jgi:hypothetical protein